MRGRFTNFKKKKKNLRLKRSQQRVRAQRNSMIRNFLKNLIRKSGAEKLMGRRYDARREKKM